MPYKTPTISSDPEIQGGAAVFAGTRVPVSNLMDCLASGETLDDFLDDFPTVSRDQAVEVLKLAREALTSVAGSS